MFATRKIYISIYHYSDTFPVKVVGLTDAKCVLKYLKKVTVMDYMVASPQNSSAETPQLRQCISK